MLFYVEENIKEITVIIVIYFFFGSLFSNSMDFYKFRMVLPIYCCKDIG